MEIHERIKYAIENSGYSYNYICERTGITKSTLYRYTAGEIQKMSIGNVKKIAAICNVSPAWIMGWDENIHNVVKTTVEYTEKENTVEGSPLVQAVSLFESLTPEKQELALGFLKAIANKE